MSVNIKAKFEEARSLAHGSIGAVYTGIGSAIIKPIRVLIIQNLTDSPMMFSFDGVTDHLPFSANGYLLLDLAANKTRDTGFYLPEGTRVYVKQITAPTSGSVYVSTIYGIN